MMGTIVLKRHKLSHISELKVHNNIFDSRFASGCSMGNCNADCCRGGVWVDIAERDRILADAVRIQRHMDPEQEHNPSLWFEKEETSDPDVPSGTATGTQVINEGCVFLQKNGRCVLQVAATAEGLDRFTYKPFFCVAYPVAVEDQELIVDDVEIAHRPQCCTAAPDGPLSIFDICREELLFVLGKEGFEELLSHRK